MASERLRTEQLGQSPRFHRIHRRALRHLLRDIILALWFIIRIKRFYQITYFHRKFQHYLQCLRPTSSTYVVPTAVGKTGVALYWAEKLGCPILSTDSRQCYKELAIGSAPPSKKKCRRADHHFIADRSIHDPITAGEYETICNG